MRKFLFTLVLLSTNLVLVAANANAAGYGTGWYGEIQASLGREDNIARTYLNDEQTDVISTISVGGGHASTLGNGQLVFSGYFISSRYRDRDSLNNLGVSLGVNYSFQPRFSYSAPWYSVSLNVLDRNFAESRPREGLLINADLSAHKRLTTELVGSIGVRYADIVFNGKSSAEKDNDDAFDTDSVEIFLGFDYALRSGATLFGEYAFRQGDVLSTVSGGLRTDREYNAETIDGAFNPLCIGGCTYAYRQDGETHLLQIGIAYPFNNFSVDFSASYFDAEGDNGRSYQDHLIKFGLIWVF